jgi:murein DD-endopeptidase MepM/ murein hydrolase activator NlpD
MKPIEDILLEQHNVYVIDRAIPYEKYSALDLSVGNSELTTEIVSAPGPLSEYINKLLSANNSSAAYGGYNEVRNLYRRSEIFNDQGSDERNIHIGLDIWAPAGTAVLAALDGSIHSFDFNPGKGNYGPTIILEHHIGQSRFFTLYGHLSLEDIENIELGDEVTKGQIIGSLGDETVNGDYPPHLHFQIIKDIADYFGDYPGVCSSSEKDFFIDNCPDPALLLKITT